MCGIIYGRSKNSLKPINKAVIKQYYNQKHRGINGFGVYDVEHKHIVKETTEKSIMKWLKGHNSTELLYHHRIPTSTINSRTGAHPFSTKQFFGQNEYILIHNGVIRNADDLAKNHDKRGITYWSCHPDGSYNDSEALLWDLALYLEGQQEKPLAYGSVAFIMIKKVNGEASKLYYYHNAGNPLLVKDTKKHFMIFSYDSTNSTREVPIDTLFAYDYHLGTTDEYDLKINQFAPWRQSSTWEYKQEEEHELEIQHEIARMAEGEAESAVEQIRLIGNYKNFRSDLQSKCFEYLCSADGKMYLAVAMLQESIGLLDNEAYSIENWYELELLRGAVGTLLTDPNWDVEDMEYVHPMFLEKEQKPLGQLVLLNENTKPAAPVSVADILTKTSDDVKSRLERIRNFGVKHDVPQIPGLLRTIPHD